jgi:hypothetical protein
MISSFQILKNMRGSEDGTPPFTANSLSAYLESNFGLQGSSKSWMIELSNERPQALLTRNLEPFRIGIYESPMSTLLQVENDIVDYIYQPYTFSIFKQMARRDGYNEEEEAYVLDLKDAIIAWAKIVPITTLTSDEDGCPTLDTFSYISNNTIIRENGFVYLELTFRAKRNI